MKTKGSFKRTQNVCMHVIVSEDLLPHSGSQDVLLLTRSAGGKAYYVIC